MTNESTLCLLIRGSRILLGMKKEHFGEGKWNGFGGKRKRTDRTIKAAAKRELEEESGVVVNEEYLERVAQIKFFEEEMLIFDCAVFIVRQWRGNPRETKEMRPQWFDLDAVPYDRMWTGDRLWWPIILEGLKISGVVRFKKGMKEVESFDYDDLAAGTK